MGTPGRNIERRLWNQTGMGSGKRPFLQGRLLSSFWRFHVRSAPGHFSSPAVQGFVLGVGDKGLGFRV